MYSQQEQAKIGLNSLRKIDPEVTSLTDKELEVVRESFYELGNLIFEDWCEQKFGSKNPTGDNNGDLNKGKM